MIVEAAAHYDDLLARVYAWMLGPRNAALSSALADLVALDLCHPHTGARALDLGAGLGLHARGLAALGYRTCALDTSRALLGELAAEAPEIEIVYGDLVTAHERLDAGRTFDAIVCLGDTLTHLPDRAAVSTALAGAAALLAPGGRIALTFRDYSSVAPGTVRHHLVRGDAERVMTCRLDYRDADVVVTDSVLERDGAGWRLHTSAYRKLRLAPADVAGELERRGLADVAIGAPGPRGLYAVVARRR